MKNAPLYHTCPTMDMDLHDHRKVSMALALAAQNMDMNIPHKNSHFANTNPWICAYGVILMPLHYLDDKHCSPHLSSDIFPIVVRK